jgi:glycosyltransferase involved in cell wall biosynthesis
VERYLAFLTKENILSVLIILFFTVTAIQLVYYVFTFSRLAFYKQKKENSTSPPVSVIICARNELKNLKAFLNSILEQDYPNYQVVVVNDCSWDETEKYLEELELQYKHLKVVELKEQERYQHGKKFALALGIKAAEHDLLLHTDADCFPASKNWITEMVAAYKTETEIVIGYGAYKKEKGLLNKWIRFDTVFNAVQYLSFSIGKNTYMGTGRNLSYKKSLFFRNKGFASHFHVLSGDDDLFVNETATKKNTNVCLTSGSFTYSKAKTSLGDWLKQKKRHLSTGSLYKSKHKFVLGLFFLCQVLFYPLLLVLLISKFKIVWVAGVFALRLLIQIVIFGKSMQRLKEKDLIWLIPVFDLFVSVIYPFVSFSNIIVKNKTWK